MKEKRINFIGNFFPGFGLGLVISYENKCIYVMGVVPFIQFYLDLNIDLNSTIGGFAGFRIAEQFLLGYSYDASINNFSNSNGGIHSFFLNIRLEDYWQRERCGCYSF